MLPLLVQVVHLKQLVVFFRLYSVCVVLLVKSLQASSGVSGPGVGSGFGFGFGLSSFPTLPVLQLPDGKKQVVAHAVAAI